ncbi:MAG: hypothetical protein Q9186_006192 [Xanthomendoza sp. 1 TL-2023]
MAISGDRCTLNVTADGDQKALEDGATRRGKLSSKTRIPALVTVYEQSKKERIASIQKQTFK